MNKWTVRLMAIVLVIAVALSAVAIAAAQGPGDRGRPFARAGLRLDFAYIVRQTVEDMTDLTWTDVLAALRDGQTLSEVLEANGADPQAVRDAVKAEATAQIEQAVADGAITQTRADALLAQLDTALDRAFNSTLPMWPAPIRDRIHQRIQDTLEDTLVGVIADQAGLETTELLREVLMPPTLGEVIENYGLDAEVVIAEAETRITEALNQRVADGSLTQDEADELLAGLHDWLVNRLDAPFWFMGRGLGRDMMPGGMGGMRGRFGGMGQRPGGVF